MDRGYAATDRCRVRITKPSGHVFFAKASHETGILSEMNNAAARGCTIGRPEYWDTRKRTWRFMLLPQEKLVPRDVA